MGAVASWSPTYNFKFGIVLGNEIFVKWTEKSSCFKDNAITVNLTMDLCKSILLLLVIGGVCWSCQESQQFEGCNIVTKRGLTQCVCGMGCERAFKFELRNECIINLMESRCNEENRRDAALRDAQSFPIKCLFE